MGPIFPALPSEKSRSCKYVNLTGSANVTNFDLPVE
jgi:hypothetical protein